MLINRFNHGIHTIGICLQLLRRRVANTFWVRRWVAASTYVLKREVLLVFYLTFLFLSFRFPTFWLDFCCVFFSFIISSLLFDFCTFSQLIHSQLFFQDLPDIGEIHVYDFTVIRTCFLQIRKVSWRNYQMVMISILSLCW